MTAPGLTPVRTRNGIIRWTGTRPIDPPIGRGTKRDVARGLDPIAVERACAGDNTVHLGPRDREEVVRILNARDMSDSRIAQHAGLTPNGVLRIRKRLGIPAADGWRTLSSPPTPPPREPIPVTVCECGCLLAATDETCPSCAVWARRNEQQHNRQTWRKAA